MMLSLSQRLWQWWGTGFFQLQHSAAHTQTKTLPYNREENQTFKSLINFHQTNADKAHCHMYKSFCSPNYVAFSVAVK